MECLNYYNMIVGSLEQGYNIDNKLADHPRHSRMFRTGVNTRVYFNNIFKSPTHHPFLIIIKL